MIPRAISRRTGRRRGSPHAGHPGRDLAAFLLVAVVTLVAVAAGTAVFSERVARASALAEAERSAVRMAQFLIAPILEEALAGVPGRWEELERRVQNRLEDQSVKALFIWTSTGEVLYASDEELIGSVLDPTPELRTAAAGNVVADVKAQSELNFAGEGEQPLVEVYAPLPGTSRPLALELYLSNDGIERQAMLLRGQILPLAVGALLVLQLVQVPIAVSLVRRVRRQDVERASLLARNLTASDNERRAIAADVHDGPVQELAGVSYGLSALRDSVAPERRSAVDRMVAATRDAVESLRRMIIDLYPPDLSGAGLPDALEDLAAAARRRGLVVTVRSSALPDLSTDAAATIYRTAKEALTNIEKHSGATYVWLDLQPDELRGRPAVRLCVDDDGVGFPATRPDHRSNGHIGLRLMADRAADLGGDLRLENRDGGGASLTLVIPADGPG
jgi:two-component system NarL family sensor kinase